jgi:hypothetical protein
MSSTFAPLTSDVFGADDLDVELSGLEAEVDGAAGGDAFGLDEFGEGLFSQYGQDNTALATDRGEDATPRIEVPAGLEVALGQAFNPGFLQTMPKFVEWARSFFPDFVIDRTFISGKGTTEAQDMARQFVSQVYPMANGDRVSAADWGQLSPDEKMDFVNQVIGSSVFGNHADSLDQVSEGWDKVLAAKGWTEKLKAAGSGWWETTKAFWGQDVWPLVKGLFPWTEEEDFNFTAMVYFSGHKVWGATNWISSSAGSAVSGMDPYPKIIAQIDAAYASVSGFVPTASAPTVRSSQVVDVPTPPVGGYAEESIPTGESSMLPRPETILAVGYLIAAVPTLVRAL